MVTELLAGAAVCVGGYFGRYFVRFLLHRARGLG